MKEKITRTAASLKNEAVNFLRDIIAIPSVSGQEAAVVQRIKQEMEKLGFKNTRIDGMGNVMGSMGNGNRVIALDGHCDTVDAGDCDKWQWDPFKGHHEKGIVYGRGASDQKGGLTSALYAAKILDIIGIPPSISLLAVASVLEEDYEGACWKYILEEDQIRPEVVILTEPSDLGIKIGQRGRLEIKIKTQGVSCHGSAPGRGDNAIYKMAPIIREIQHLNDCLHSTSPLGKGTVTVTDVRSTAPSLCAVPDSAVIHLDRRLSEGETPGTAVKEICSLKSVKQVGAHVYIPEVTVRSYTGHTFSLQPYYPVWRMDIDHPLVQAAAKAYGHQFSKTPGTGFWQFSTNGVVTKGLFDIPTIGFGPGEEKYAHTSTDQIRESDLIEAMEFYTAFVLTWAGMQPC